MANNNRINIDVGFTVDKKGLQDMQDLLQSIAIQAKNPGQALDKDLKKAGQTAAELDRILEKTFNTDLGSLNVVKFNQELEKSGLTLKTVQNDFSKIGNQGVTAYNKIAQAILGTNIQLKETNKFLDRMATTFGNVIRYSLSSAVTNRIVGSIEKAYSYSVKLDESLNNIRIVTDKSADNMDKFAVKANDAAKALGANTLDYTNAALIYYQQGLSDQEAQARAETTVKAANITGQKGEEVSEQLTAVWNGYKVTAQETELYVDKLAAVAATTAADLEELSTGMSKVAPAANAMGVDFDDLNAQIATIVSVTRQAPESVGTALKTIYARLGDLKVDGVDEFGVSLGEVSGQMSELGIQILDQQGNLRDMSTVISEVAGKWDTWTSAQRQAVAIAMAGKRQYNNLLALFENWDMYSKALETSANAMGTLQKQQDIYMESTEAKLNKLKATAQDLYGDLVDNNELNTGIDAIRNLVQVFDNFIASFGGGVKSITALGVVLSNIFNKQITNALIGINSRLDTFKNNVTLLENKLEVFKNGASQLDKATATPSQLGAAAGLEAELNVAKQIYDVRAGLTEQQAQVLIESQKNLGVLVEQKTVLEQTALQQESVYLQDSQINEILNADLSLAREISSEYLNRLENSEIQLEKEKEIVNTVKNILTEEEDISKNYHNAIIAKEDILTLSEEIGLLDKQELANALKKLTNMESLYESRERIVGILEKAVQEQTNLVNTEKQEAKSADKVYQIKEKIYDLDLNIQNKEQEINAELEKGSKGNNIAKYVTTLSSTLTSSAMALSSISSLFDTLGNESISFGDKITQTFMTLSFSIPLAISSFKKLGETIGYDSTLIDIWNAKKEASVAITEAATVAQHSENVAKELGTAQYEKEIALIISKVSAEEAEKIITDEAAGAQIIKNIADEQGCLINEKVIAAIMARIAAVKAETKAIEKQIAVREILDKLLFKSKAGKVAIALAVLVGIITIATKAVQKWHEVQVKNAEQDLKNIKTTQEEIKTHKELIDSYNELYKTYKETGEGKDDLLKKGIELADAYGKESLRVLALAGDYDTLAASIKQLRGDELASLEGASEDGASAAATLAAESASKGSGATFGTSKIYNTELKSLNSAANQNYSDFKGPLAELHELAKGDITTPEEMQKYINLVNDSISYIQKLPEEQRKNYSGVLKELREEQSQLADQAEELNNQLDQLYSARTEKAFLDFDPSVESAEALKNKIDEVKAEFIKNGLSEEDAQKYINTYLDGIDDIQVKLKSSRISLAEQLAGGDKELEKTLLSQLEDFNANQLALLQVHFDTSLWDGDLKTWKTKNEAYLTYQGQTGASQTFKDYIKGFNTETGITHAQSDNIYSDPTMAAAMGVSQGAFNAMDAEQQINVLTNAYIKNTETIEENRQAALKTENDRLAALQDTDNELRKNAESYEDEKNHLNELIEGSEEYKGKASELIEALRQQSKDSSKLTDDQQALIEGFKNENKEFEEGIDTYAAAAEATGAYEDACKQTEASIAALEADTDNYKSSLEIATASVERSKTAMDNLQSAYSSLVSIVNDYNSTGAWTIDNVQKLMEMDDKYVATLQFENGQLSINESAIQTMTLAKIDDLEQSAILTAQSELEALANKEVAEAAGGATASIQAAAQAAREGADAALAGAEAWGAYAESMRASYGVSDSKYDKEAQQITDALKAKLLAAENARSQAKKGGAAMRTAMGAGSKSGSSKQSEKELKNLDDEFDRYWELNKIIDKTDRALQKLEKDKENLYRNELVDALAKENNLLEEQVQHYKDLAAAQRQEAGELQGKLMNNGVQFDAQGNITNYATATQSMLSWYNQGVNAQNAGSISDDEFSKIYEKGFEEFKKNLERYDTLFYKEIKDTEDKIDESTRKIIANNLKKWEVEIELKLNLKELDREWNKFLKEINTDFKKVYKNIQADLDLARKNAATFLGENGTLTVDVTSVTDLVNEFNKLESGLGSDKFESISQVQDKMREVNTQLQKDAKDLFDTYQESWESYLDAIDQTGNKFDDIQNQFKKISDELEFQKDLINLIYGDKAYDLIDTLYKGQEQSTLAQITALKQESDAWKEMFDLSGATLENQAEWNEDQKKYYEEWQDAQNALNDLVKEHIDLLKNDYLNSINKILQSLEKGITKSSLDDVKTDWERISDHSSKYLDNIEKSYEIQKLANKFNEGIADTTSLKNQQRLTQLRDREVAILREKEELTKFDIDAAEARYQIALKEMALEDAQNNKTNMKLTRNEQGNWSYQYVADEEDITSKRQDLLAAYNDLYQLASDAYESNLSALESLNETYLEKLKEIAELSLTDKEEAEKQRLELDEWYFEEYELLANDNAIARQTLIEAGSAIILESYRQDQAAYESMTQAEREMLDLFINENILDYQDLEDKIRANYDNMGTAAAGMIETARIDWNAKSQEMANTWNGDGGESVKNQVAEAYNSMENNLAQYANNLNALQEQAGVNFGESGITGSINQATNATNAATKATETLTQTMQSQLPSAKAQVDAISTAWLGVKSSVEQAITALQYYINKMVSAQQQAQQTTIAAQQAAAAMSAVGSSGNGAGGGAGSGARKLASNDGYTYYTDPNGVANTNAIVKNSKIVAIVSTGGSDWSSRKAAMDKWATSHGYDAFNTGGYTGSWNNGDSVGRIAMLHQKELVLNAEDTENFLSGINMIRNMAALNGSINDAIVRSVANMVLTLGETKAVGVTGLNTSNNSESNNNTFNITAEFPNANSVDEIREAILSLPNIASQYVNSNKI